METGGPGHTDLTAGRIYTVVSVERGWYRLVDDSGEDYLYPPHLFSLDVEG